MKISVPAQTGHWPVWPYTMKIFWLRHWQCISRFEFKYAVKC